MKTFIKGSACRGFLILLALCFDETWAGESPIGMAISLKGAVTSDVGRDKKSIVPMAYLYENDEILVESTSELVFTHYGKQLLIKVVGPSGISLTKDGFKLISGEYPKSQPMTEKMVLLKNQSGLVAGATRMRVINTSYDSSLVYPPPESLLLSHAFEFKWPGEITSEYLVEWRIEGADQTLHRAKVRGNTYQMPPEIKLPNDIKIIWKISLLSDDASSVIRPMVSSFQVAGDDIIHHVRSLKPTPESDFAEKILFLHFLQSRKAFIEADQYLKSISPVSP
ncbi:MAG: hypothetical protein QE278_11510 [Limnobacter sp.]|nr:hypothetical protein [Limnobacter sp.]